MERSRRQYCQKGGIELETGGSSIAWEEMGMDAVTLDFRQLFPEYTFDGRVVMSLILQGRIWDAIKELGSGIGGAFSSHAGEIRTLFVTILIL